MLKDSAALARVSAEFVNPVTLDKLTKLAKFIYHLTSGLYSPLSRLRRLYGCGVLPGYQLSLFGKSTLRLVSLFVAYEILGAPGSMCHFNFDFYYAAFHISSERPHVRLLLIQHARRYAGRRASETYATARCLPYVS
jgi:hypothetical protein